MEMLNRSTLMKAHAVLAAVILPVAIMFFVTGALYTWGIKGGYETNSYELQLENPIQKDLTTLINIVERELNSKNISVPSGQAKIKTIGPSYQLEWTGSDIDIILEPTSKPSVASLQIKDTSWYRNLVQLHKAKGGTPFKVYAAAFATALLLLLITGFIMAWQTPKLRQLTLTSTGVGIAIFIAMVVSS